MNLTLVLSYLLTIPVFAALDLVWLGYVAKDFYRQHLGAFLSPEVNWTAAIVFYLLFIGGIFYFCILPAFEKNSLQHAAISGAIFGLMTYATYDLTNLATLKDWPLPIVFVDILWGMVITGLVSMAGFLILRYFNS